MVASATSHSSLMTQADSRPSHGETRVGVGVPGEGTHFRDHHRVVHRFNLMLNVGDVEDPITSVTAQSCK
jgi:hypothetical protein